MALNDPADKDRLTIERWAGPVASADIAKLEALLKQFGSPEIVALQELTTRRGQLVTRTANKSAGRNRSDHSKNLDGPVDEQIARLVSYINRSDLPMTPEGEEVVNETVGGPGTASEVTIVVDTIRHSPRRG